MDGTIQMAWDLSLSNLEAIQGICPALAHSGALGFELAHHEQINWTTNALSKELAAFPTPTKTSPSVTSY
jgi:hypothetical protein